MNDFVFVETVGYLNRSNIIFIEEPIKLNSDGHYRFTIYFSAKSHTVKKDTKEECEAIIRRIIR